MRALGANNRLDVVLRRDGVGSTGIEIKCLGIKGHTGKLTHGLGQEELRQLGAKICVGARVRLVFVP